MLRMRSHLTMFALVGLFGVFGLGSPSAQSETCGPDQFGTLIDDTGAYLRDFSTTRRPQLHQKFQELAAKNNWAPESAVDRGYQAVRDNKITDFDARGRKLLIELDRIGALPEDVATCRDLDRLKAVTLELRAVTEAKFKHMMSRADAMLGAAEPKRVEASNRAEKPKPASRPPVRQPRRKAANSSPTNQSRPNNSDWQTTTQSTPAPPPSVLSALPPPEPMPVETTYSASEIAEAGRGFFGNISAGLASVIQYTFKAYGKPNGYILGTEGGAAFLAGLSFGEGHLTTKSQPRRKVFWQSPTVGYDLGLQGSRVMFLVYNLKKPDDIFRRFAGIGGSAYVVGGVGLTYHKRGKVVLAPIRTGLGLRVGANIGYLKFTPRLSINPF